MLPGAWLSSGSHLDVFTGFLAEFRVYTRPHSPSVITQNAFIAVTENLQDLLVSV